MSSQAFIAGLFAKALVTAQSHEDEDTRARAAEKMARFAAAFAGIAAGSLRVGSRTPVASIPVWATLEVVAGGFATGALAAGGPLLPHEQRRLADDVLASSTGAPSLPPGRTDRERLNLYFITDRGMAELTSMLTSGRYRVRVPEEGALLVAAWLLARGERADAWTIIDAIGPFFDRLRFYPEPHDVPLTESAVVRLQPVSTTKSAIERLDVPPQVAAMNETLRVWIPFEDELVTFLRAPILDRARARELVTEYRALAAKHTLAQRRHRAKETLGALVRLVATVASRESGLDEAERAELRRKLADIGRSRGFPGAAEHAALRDRQARDARVPTRKDHANVVRDRLALLPAEAGLSPAQLAEVSVPIADEDDALYDSIVRKLERSLETSIEELVERGVIPSGEVLAVVAPQITAQVRAAALHDPDLRRVYGAVYAAFRRRRSLLLLNLEHQVRIEELPWIAGIERFRRARPANTKLARTTLEELAVLAITSFPSAILPNKLLTELAALANGAELDQELPIVEELAADIFMGTFTTKFVRAAKIAASLLRDTLYARYYALPVHAVLALPEPKRGDDDTSFADLCRARARIDVDVAGDSRWARGFVARNGRVIEQEQILTTHNLASLFAALDLDDKLRARLPDLARACFAAVCRSLDDGIDPCDQHTRLVRVKNSAYAWRQMIFFLSLASPDALPAFLAWADAHLVEHTRGAFRARFAPAMRGLRLAALGATLRDDDDDSFSARRFLGWTLGPHWALPAEAPASASASASA